MSIPEVNDFDSDIRASLVSCPPLVIEEIDDEIFDLPRRGEDFTVQARAA